MREQPAACLIKSQRRCEVQYVLKIRLRDTAVCAPTRVISWHFVFERVGGKRFVRRRVKNKRKPTFLEGNYSSFITKLKFFVPAATQSFTSLLMASSKMIVSVALLLKTLTFLSFQMTNVTSIVRDFMALRFGLSVQVIMFHRYTRVMSIVHSFVFMDETPIQVFTISQRLLE
jgi:uncharacterized membrane protein